LVGGNPILIVWDEPMPGVARPWFECPRCARRCRHIFLEELACRKCLRLDYASRHLYRQTSGVHRVARLRRKLGADPRPFAPLPECRHGRHRAHHEKLVAKIHAEEQALVEHLQTITGDLNAAFRFARPEESGSLSPWITPSLPTSAFMPLLGRTAAQSMMCTPRWIGIPLRLIATPI
jgi:hypothetical protein